MKSNAFQRKLAVEFVDNIDLIKQKTSRAKKTLRSMIAFMNERVNIESKYSASLQSLAKTGGVSNMNYEEQSLRDAINAMINFTIQESELHREFAGQTKLNIVSALDDTRKNLSLNKKGWQNKLQALKKQITEANEASKREHIKLQQQAGVVEELRKKREEQYTKFGLNLDDAQMRIENMPSALQQIERKYQEALSKLGEFKKASAAQQENTEKCVADFNKGQQDCLEQIEKQEYQRLDVLRLGLSNFSLAVSNLVQQNDSLHKLLDLEIAQVDPLKDLQTFIQRHSTFADNERLRNLYKELGLYQPLYQLNPGEDPQAAAAIQGSDKPWLMSAGLMVEKTSRSMAQQLKQMEENRKKKALEEEFQKKEQLKLKKVQGMVDHLKETREFLYKLGTKAGKGSLEHYLTTVGTGQPKGAKKAAAARRESHESADAASVEEDQKNDNSFEAKSKKWFQKEGKSGVHLQEQETFKIGSGEVLDQLIFTILSTVQRSISPDSLQLIKQHLCKTELSFTTDLVSYLQQFKFQDMFSVLHKLLEYYYDRVTSLQGEEQALYKCVLGLVWAWVRLIVLRGNGFNAEAYQRDMSQFLDEADYAHHQQHQCTVEAIDFTFNAMKYAQKVAHKEVLGGFSYPLNYLVHARLLPVYVVENAPPEAKSLLSPNFQDIFFNLQGFSQNFLGVKNAFQLLHITRSVFTSHLTGDHTSFAEFDIKQNQALYTLKTIMQKITKEYGGVLKQKLLSVELITDKGIQEPLDQIFQQYFLILLYIYYSQTGQEAQKILFRLNNCWLMSDVCRDIFKILEAYETRFGECHNKLRLTLDLLSISYKLSFVFVSDGSLQQRLKTEVLTKAGERRADQICHKFGIQKIKQFLLIEAPFSIESDLDDRTSLLEAIRIFTEQLQLEEATFKKVWDSHITTAQNGKVTDESTGMHFYSQKLAQIIEEDLSGKLEDLDFDKHEIVGELIEQLQLFDRVSKRQTLNVIKPKLEQWLQVKLVSIRELVSRAIAFETWTPISETQMNSESVVNVFFTLTETMENLYDFVGRDIFLRWSKCIQVMIHDVIFEYCECLLRGLDNIAQFKPAEVLPPINLQARKGKRPKEVSAALFQQMAGMGSKNWVDFAAANDQAGLSLQKLLTRLANLDFIQAQLHYMKVRFFSLSGHGGAPSPYFEEAELFVTASDIILDTSKRVMRFTADKLVYIDFNDIIFANLYLGKEQQVVTLRQQLIHLNDLIRVVFMQTPRRYFKEMLNTLHITLIDALLRYLMLLSSLGSQVGVNSDFFFSNPILLSNDIREIIVFFSPKDKDVSAITSKSLQGKDIGLSKDECERNSEVILRFLQYMREDDQMLVALFKSVDSDVQRNREIISRILYRRTTKDVDKFFEDYKTLFGGK